MNPQERKIIDDLFDKLGQAERQASPREPIAEAHIRSRIERQPGAPYLMAQTIVVQEQALDAAQTRIAGLEDELKSRPTGGGFLSGLFGGGTAQREPTDLHGTMRPGAVDGSRFAGQGLAQDRPGRGGGFLAGAAQTAMGVAGGVLLGSMIGSAFGGGQAQAAEPEAVEPEPAAADDGADFGDDLGGDI